MLCTDSLKDLTIHPVLAHRIPAKNIDCVGLDELIAEFLHRNCCLGITLCPEEMNTFCEIATRGCPTLAAFAALGMRFPKASINKTGSGIPLSMNAESMSSASSATYRPCLTAAPTFKPRTSKLERRLTRCDSVATTITTLPPFRAAEMNCVTF